MLLPLSEPVQPLIQIYVHRIVAIVNYINYTHVLQQYVLVMLLLIED